MCKGNVGDVAFVGMVVRVVCMFFCLVLLFVCVFVFVIFVKVFVVLIVGISENQLMMFFDLLFVVMGVKHVCVVVVWDVIVRGGFDLMCVI